MRLLRVHVSLDVTLCGAQRSMSSQHLNVPERAPNSRNRSRCIGDEGASAGMAGTTLQPGKMSSPVGGRRTFLPEGKYRARECGFTMLE